MNIHPARARLGSQAIPHPVMHRRLSGDERTMVVQPPFEPEEPEPEPVEDGRVAGWVVVRDKECAGSFFTIHVGHNRVGTLPDMEVVVTDSGVVPWHATIIAGAGGDCVLVDKGSPAGTFLNGRRVSRTRIVDNDVIRFASTTVRFKSFF